MASLETLFASCHVGVEPHETTPMAFGVWNCPLAHHWVSSIYFNMFNREPEA